MRLQLQLFVVYKRIFEFDILLKWFQSPASSVRFDKRIPARECNSWKTLRKFKQSKQLIFRGLGGFTWKRTVCVQLARRAGIVRDAIYNTIASNVWRSIPFQCLSFTPKSNAQWCESLLYCLFNARNGLAHTLRTVHFRFGSKWCVHYNSTWRAAGKKAQIWCAATFSYVNRATVIFIPK